VLLWCKGRAQRHLVDRLSRAQWKPRPRTIAD
jgi:hypothetical protein